MNKIEIGSSSGTVVMDRETGKAIEVSIDYGEVMKKNFLYDIDRFDLEEWKRTYPGETMPDCIDILDLGYWMKDGSYEEPCKAWREDRDQLVKEEAAYEQLKTEYERRVGLPVSEFEAIDSWVKTMINDNWTAKQCVDYVIEKYDLMDMDKFKNQPWGGY